MAGGPTNDGGMSTGRSASKRTSRRSRLRETTRSRIDGTGNKSRRLTVWFAFKHVPNLGKPPSTLDRTLRIRTGVGRSGKATPSRLREVLAPTESRYVVAIRNLLTWLTSAHEGPSVDGSQSLPETARQATYPGNGDQGGPACQDISEPRITTWGLSPTPNPTRLSASSAATRRRARPRAVARAARGCSD